MERPIILSFCLNCGTWLRPEEDFFCSECSQSERAPAAEQEIRSAFQDAISEKQDNYERE